MGYAKQQMIQEGEQGWSFVHDKAVCPACIDDAFVQDWIRERAEELACDYCGATSTDEPGAVPVNDLFELLNDGIRFEYDEALEWLPYDSESKSLFGSWESSYELAYNFEPNLFLNDGIAEEFIDSFNSRMFCQRDPFALTEGDALRTGWQRFSEHVRYRTRYLFLDDPTSRSEGHWSTHGFAVADMLEGIAESVVDLSLIRAVDAGGRFFRVRVHDFDEPVTDAASLGPPPGSKSRYANRMSAAGIAMFYGAFQAKTAIRETFDPSVPAADRTVTVGEFELSKAVELVDLTGRLPVPSLFDETQRALRAKVGFINGFAHDVAQPIQKDGHEHIDYVPTQVVTEYFRRVFATRFDRRVDGVIFRSVHDQEALNVALFATSEDCVDIEPGWAASGSMLGLDRSTVQHLSHSDAASIVGAS